jgi:hypothetical protein
MGLTARQQRILDGIGGALQTRDPRLAGMFSTFTRLNRHEPMPWREQLVPGPLMRATGGLRPGCTAGPRLLALVFVPVLLALIACLLLASPLSGSPHGCGSMLAVSSAQPAGGLGPCSAAHTGSSAPARPAPAQLLLIR